MLLNNILTSINNNLLDVNKCHIAFINNKGVYPLINNLNNTNNRIQLYSIKCLSALCTSINILIIRSKNSN